jgi:hypothetical protein
MPLNVTAARKHRLSHVMLLGAALLIMGLLSMPRAFAANYPLELTNIKPSGQLPASHRHYRAYPGIEYNIRAAVIGGDYPYTFTLANAPAGMTINANTGVISWPNPQASATPTITVRDRMNITVSATWTINVTTNNFKFVDAVRGQSAPTGTGTAANPWRTMADVFNNTTAADIVYYRAGTYNQSGLPVGGVGGDWEGVLWRDKAPVWLAYPGERPIINFRYTGGGENSPLIRHYGDNVYIDGFEIINIRNIGFQFPSDMSVYGPTYRRLLAHELGPSVSGSNASFIMTITRTTGRCSGGVIQDSEFYNASTGNTTIKIYSQHKILIEDNYTHDVVTGIELKDSIEQFTVRGNRFDNVQIMPLGGNMHSGYLPTSGEILHNLIRNPGNYALRVNHDGMATSIWVYRNTLIGQVMVAPMDASDGPFTFNNNVIVNTFAEPRITLENPVTSRISILNNLTAAQTGTLVDANGNLTPANAQYIGTHGYQLGPSGPRPNPPTGVTARP